MNYEQLKENLLHSPREPKGLPSAIYKRIRNTKDN